METVCKHCGNKHFHKNGKTQGSQRYICTSCRRTFCDKLRKYPQKFKQTVIKCCLRGMGIRAVAEVFEIAMRTVSLWLQAFREEIREEIEQAKEQLKSDFKPDIIEMDEIYTYCKKKQNEKSYGLLILDGNVVLLAL